MMRPPFQAVQTDIAIAAGQDEYDPPGKHEWPLGTYLELGSLPSAVPCARLHSRQVVWEWGLANLADTVELIVSELVSNAIRASGELTGTLYNGRWIPGTPPVRLWLRSDCKNVLIRVWDGNDAMPARRDADPVAENGRGLLIVEALSAQWGSYTPEKCMGKVTWSVVAGTT